MPIGWLRMGRAHKIGRRPVTIHNPLQQRDDTTRLILTPMESRYLYPDLGSGRNRSVAIYIPTHIFLWLVPFPSPSVFYVYAALTPTLSPVRFWLWYLHNCLWFFESFVCIHTYLQEPCVEYTLFSSCWWVSYAIVLLYYLRSGHHCLLKLVLYLPTGHITNPYLTTHLVLYCSVHFLYMRAILFYMIIDRSTL